MGVPISYLFWLATKWGYEGFGSLWSIRFLGFATSMMTFPIMTWLYLGETITLKTAISIVLAVIIMLLQLLQLLTALVAQLRYNYIAYFENN